MTPYHKICNNMAVLRQKVNPKLANSNISPSASCIVVYNRAAHPAAPIKAVTGE
eukprot:CAMPEP_0195271970 /NCGR_PEP_ID=MMETSP0706-20130129/15449_1 /TAXON_ID=33640 /ORGANISM="Asterionellopsis glacialis, Strain CCMP134" /LENGTH=53 /DNA_ID=CAMNT_0040327907 /DNA_START=80 /DNA_END=241 /DNA_ORIENTATION=+